MLFEGWGNFFSKDSTPLFFMTKKRTKENKTLNPISKSSAFCTTPTVRRRRFCIFKRTKARRKRQNP